MSSNTYKAVVIGATGAVGKNLVKGTAIALQLTNRASSIPVLFKSNSCCAETIPRK